jgi:hypothetical protein
MEADRNRNQDGGRNRNQYGGPETKMATPISMERQDGDVQSDRHDGRRRNDWERSAGLVLTVPRRAALPRPICDSCARDTRDGHVGVTIPESTSAYVG